MWTTDQSNSQRNGQSGAPAMLTLKTDTDFGASSGGSGTGSIAQAPVFSPGNFMCYAATNGAVECRDVNSCALLWTYQGPASPTTLTLGADGTIYYGHSQGLSALSGSGALLWTFTTYGACVLAPAIGHDGTLYSCFSHPPSGYAAGLVGISTGGQATSFAMYTNAQPNGSPLSIATINGVESVLYPSTSGQIMPFAASNGATVWQRVYCQLGGPLHGSIAAGSNGWLYALASVAGVGQLSACDVSGNIVWTYELNEAAGATSTPALSLDGGTVYVMGTNLHAVNAADGTLLWQTSGMSFLGSPVVSAEGYIGGINTQTECLEFRNLQGVISGNPYYAMLMATGPMSVSGDGSVFVAQTNGRVRIARNSPGPNPLPPAPPPAPPAPPAPAPTPAPPPTTRSVPITSALCYGQSYPASVQLASPQQHVQLAATSFSPTGLAVDPATLDVYWTDGPVIFKCPSAGGAAQTVVNALGFNPTSLALDLPNMRIFCCDASGGAVCCINLASGTTTRLVTGLNLPMAVAVDVAGNQLFWVEYNPGCLQKSDLSGQSVTRLLGGIALPQSVVIDPSRQQVYLAAKTEIASCGYDGLGLATVVTLATAQPNSNSRKLALDVGAQKLYWTDQASQSIQCISLADGSSTTLLSKTLTPGFANPTVIALVTS